MPNSLLAVIVVIHGPNSPYHVEAYLRYMILQLHEEYRIAILLVSETSIA